jgi:hypothetical protein
MRFTLSEVLGDEQLSVLAVRKHSSSKKVFNVDLSDDTTVLVSIAKAYDDDGLPLFMNEDETVKAGWEVRDGWLFPPGTNSGLSAERA